MKTTFARVIQALLLLAMLQLVLASYVGAYFLTQETAHTGTNGVETFTVRYYPTEWHVVLFQPAAAIESVLCNRETDVQFTP
jgi:hypothetical protein